MRNNEWPQTADGLRNLVRQAMQTQVLGRRITIENLEDFGESLEEPHNVPHQGLGCMMNQLETAGEHSYNFYTFSEFTIGKYSDDPLVDPLTFIYRLSSNILASSFNGGQNICRLAGNLQ